MKDMEAGWELGKTREKLGECRKQRKLLESEVNILRSKSRKLLSILDEQKKRGKNVENRLSIHKKSGLPNHFRLDHELPALLDEVRTAKPLKGFAVAIAKLDNSLDVVTRTLKSTISDWIIYQIGVRIQETLSSEDSLFHSRDDEFIIVLSGFQNEKELHKRLSQVSMVISMPMIFSGYHINIGSSIGAAMFPDHGMTKEAILHSADIALGFAREQQEAWQIFQEEMREKVIEKLELQTSILKALESQAIKEISKQFEIYLQPLVTISGIHGDIIYIEKVDAEALIRWNHPKKGLVSPGQFIPLAEETGLIQPIGNWVLYQTIKQLEKWNGTDLGDVHLSMNISPRQFINDQLMDNVINIVTTRPSVRERLKLEITETCVMDDPVSAIRKMNVLKDRGISFSVDDFGSGYSSLSYLRQLPVSTLKIDKGFIDTVDENHNDIAIIKAILAMAREMGFDVVCEGVERFSQVKTLVQERCMTIQGFFFAKPMPVDQFEQYYRSVISSPMKV
jgi:EAL domain-containing protein (putative c-di-GMP-specific phosphodiesterase class I)/GGDEF domain-containing protein